MPTSCINCLVNLSCLFYKAKFSNIDSLTDSLITFHFKKGQSLFMEGDKKKGFYFIKSGKIKCVKIDTTGKETIFKLASKGDVLGYSIAFMSKENHEYCSICMEDAIICFMPYHITKNDIGNNYEFLKLIAEIQYLDTSLMVQIILNNTNKTVKERIAYAILMLYQKFGKDKDGYIDILITREEIANMSATTTESAIRYISEFQKDKIILIKNKQIKIINPTWFIQLFGNI